MFKHLGVNMEQLKRDPHIIPGDKHGNISDKNILGEINSRKNSKFKHMAIQLGKMEHTGFQNENMYQ